MMQNSICEAGDFQDFYNGQAASLADGLLEQYVPAHLASGLEQPSVVPPEIYQGSRSNYIDDIDRVLMNQYEGINCEEDIYNQIIDPPPNKERDDMRVIRRLEMCARAREESTKIMSLRVAERNSVRDDMLREKRKYEDLEAITRKDRQDRWTQKTQKSPFNVDLLAQHQRLDEESKMRIQMESRKAKIAARKERETQDALTKKVGAHEMELEALRKEKRQLLENEKKLKAMRDLEKSNARTEMILQSRRNRQLELIKQRNQQV